MARSLATLLLIAALAVAATATSASARRSSSADPTAAAADAGAAALAAGPLFAASSDDGNDKNGLVSVFATGCAGGLPPMLEFEEVDRRRKRKRKNDDDKKKPDKGFFCDGDKSGSGPKPSSSSSSSPSSPSLPSGGGENDLALSYARSLGWDLNGTSSGVTRRSCWGTFRAYWRCPEHEGAGACLECKGHHSWLRAPCGAEIAVCDGLMHHFAKFEKRHDGNDDASSSSSTETTWRVFFGAGALGKTVAIKAPPEKKDRAISPEEDAVGAADDDDVSRRRHRRHRRRHDDDNGDDDEEKWSKVRMHWTSEGLSGQAWTAKKIDGGWGAGPEEENENEGDANAFDAIAAEARAALADAGLAVLPDRDSTFPSSSSPSSSSSNENPSALRALASRVASLFFSSSSSEASLGLDDDGGGFRARATCNGERPRWPGAPCKGEAKVEWEKKDGGEGGDGNAHGTAVCDGFWSGSAPRRTANKCLGFSQVSATKGQWSVWKHCNGASASKRGGGSCPWHRDNGKKGMASWCHGGSSGAIVRKPEEEEEEVVEVETQEKMVTI